MYLARIVFGRSPASLSWIQCFEAMSRDCITISWFEMDGMLALSSKIFSNALVALLLGAICAMISLGKNGSQAANKSCGGGRFQAYARFFVHSIDLVFWRCIQREQDAMDWQVPVLFGGGVPCD